YPLSEAHSFFMRCPNFCPYFSITILPFLPSAICHPPSAICYLLSASLHPRRLRIILIILRQPNHRPLVLFPRARRRIQQIQFPPVILRARTCVRHERNPIPIR